MITISIISSEKLVEFPFRGKEKTPELLSLAIGTTKSLPGQPGSIVRNVTRVIHYSRFINVKAGDDIALLYIDTPVDYTHNIKPACLPLPEDVYSSRSHCYLTGWGKTGTTGTGDDWPEDLQEAKYKLTSTAACNQSWDGAIQDSMVCAG